MSHKRIKKVSENRKRHLHVLISEDVYRMLVELAPQIYGEKKHRGALSAIVEEALRLYLEPRHTQIHTNPKRSVRIVYSQVVEKIKEVLHISFKPEEVPEKILDLAISEVRGSDWRTIEKWKDIFMKSGLIKPVGGNPPNRIFELIG